MICICGDLIDSLFDSIFLILVGSRFQALPLNMQGGNGGQITDEDKQQLIHMMKNINGQNNNVSHNFQTAQNNKNVPIAHSTSKISAQHTTESGGGGTPLPVKNSGKLVGH